MNKQILSDENQKLLVRELVQDAHIHAGILREEMFRELSQHLSSFFMEMDGNRLEDSIANSIAAQYKGAVK